MKDWKLMESLEQQVKAVARQLGERIRGTRKLKLITLEGLSRETGLSPGFLSRLERGETSASISNLIVIASQLGIPLREFFDEPDNKPAPNYVLTRAQSRNFTPPLTARGYTYHLTSGALENQQMSAFELVYPPGEISHGEVLTHKGEEVLYLLEGSIQFTIGGDSMDLNEGDCVHFSCDQPHMARNTGDIPARVLMVVTPTDSI
jgi:transcriptional regulator with XRE-family HTH domain